MNDFALEVRRAVPTLQLPSSAVTLGGSRCLSDLQLLVNEDVILCLTSFARTVWGSSCMQKNFFYHYMCTVPNLRGNVNHQRVSSFPLGGEHVDEKTYVSPGKLEEPVSSRCQPGCGSLPCVLQAPWANHSGDTHDKPASTRPLKTQIRDTGVWRAMEATNVDGLWWECRLREKELGQIFGKCQHWEKQVEN